MTRFMLIASLLLALTGCSAPEAIVQVIIGAAALVAPATPTP